MMKFDVTASIVVYNNDLNVLQKTIKSFLATTLNVKLYIVDNSPNQHIKQLCDDSRINYTFVDKNIGFGSAHNIILRNATQLGKYHLILNPDIYIPSNTLTSLCSYMDNNKDVGVVMPRILYPDDTVQYLPKLFPKPINLVIRFVSPLLKLFKSFDDRYMLVNADYSNPIDVAIVSGCFMFAKKECFDAFLFDERFFMYFEDFDLSRQIGEKYKLQMEPRISVYHDYERGSHKSFFLFKVLLTSMVKYFNKYGWFIDRYRKLKNLEILQQLK